MSYKIIYLPRDVTEYSMSLEHGVYIMWNYHAYSQSSLWYIQSGINKHNVGNIIDFGCASTVTISDDNILSISSTENNNFVIAKLRP